MKLYFKYFLVFCFVAIGISWLSHKAVVAPSVTQSKRPKTIFEKRLESKKVTLDSLIETVFIDKSEGFTPPEQIEKATLNHIDDLKREIDYYQKFDRELMAFIQNTIKTENLKRNDKNRIVYSSPDGESSFHISYRSADSKIPRVILYTNNKDSVRYTATGNAFGNYDDIFNERAVRIESTVDEDKDLPSDPYFDTVTIVDGKAVQLHVLQSDEDLLFFPRRRYGYHSACPLFRGLRRARASHL